MVTLFKTIIDWFGTFPNAVSAAKVSNISFALSLLIVAVAYFTFYYLIGTSRNEKISKYNKIRHWRFIAFLVFFVNVFVSIAIWNSNSLGWGSEMYIFGVINGIIALVIFSLSSLSPLKSKISIHTKSVPKLF